MHTHARTHTSNLNDHKLNMLELHTYEQTHTYTTHNSKTPN